MEAPDKPAELEFRRFARSKVMRYKGQNPLIFFRESVVEGKTVRKPIAGVALPTLAGKYLFIFQPASDRQATAKPAEEYKIHAADDSLAALPVNSLVFFNATGVPLTGMIGDEKIELPAGLRGPFDVRKYSNERMFVSLVVRYADNYKMVLQNRWSFSPNNRTIVLLLPPKKSGSFRLQSFRIAEYVSPNPPEPADGNAAPPEPLDGQ